MALILVIDDDKAVRRLLREMLELDGHTVTDAPDGAKGLKALEKAPCDLVITDIFMPERDGLATLMELRQHHPGLKAIAISGGSPRVPLDMLHAAQRLGAAKTLAKPIRCADLLAAVTEVLG